jgi:putative membrane protein
MLKKIRFLGQVFEQRDEIILRDYLALERTKLANQRTLLAFLRTSLYMLLGGIAFLRLTDFESIRWMGYVSLAFSVMLIFIGVVRYYVIKARLTRYYKKNIMGESTGGGRNEG